LSFLIIIIIIIIVIIIVIIVIVTTIIISITCTAAMVPMAARACLAVRRLVHPYLLRPPRTFCFERIFGYII
jgi:hypothetical protein